MPIPDDAAHDPSTLAYDRQLVPWLFEQWVEPFIDLAEPSPAARMLDLACGSGLVTRHLVNRLDRAGRIDDHQRTQVAAAMIARLARHTDQNGRLTLSSTSVLASATMPGTKDVSGSSPTSSTLAATQAGHDIDAVPGLIGTLAMIDRSPYTIVNGFLAADDERQARAVEAKVHLDALDRNWDTIARENAAIATTLDAIGRTESLQLLEHAYTLVNVGLYVIHGVGELSEFPAAAFSFLGEPNH